MARATHHGGRSRRRDDKHPFAGRGLTREDAAELLPERTISGPSIPAGADGEARGADVLIEPRGTRQGWQAS